MKKALQSRRSWAWFAVVMVSFCIQACAVMPLKSPEEALRQRVEQLMNAKAADDWGRVYDLLDSSYRKQITKPDFLDLKRKIQFSNYQFESLAIDPSGNMADVMVKFDWGMGTFVFKDQTETQKWIREDGDWYWIMEKEGDAVSSPMD